MSIDLNSPPVPQLPDERRNATPGGRTVWASWLLSGVLSLLLMAAALVAIAMQRDVRSTRLRLDVIERDSSLRSNEGKTLGQDVVALRREAEMAYAANDELTKKLEASKGSKRATVDAAEAARNELAASEAIVATLKSEESPAVESELKNPIVVDLGGGVTLEMVLIRRGSFIMGSALGDERTMPHSVKVTRSFYLGRHEVTQEQWETVMGNNPSHFKGAKRPVENISWNDCQLFLDKLKHKMEGLNISLPTEAQWEYACRAGSKDEYCFGNDERLLDDYAWHFYDNPDKTTQEVGTKKSNAWGLHDMHGNVSEWCADWFSESYPEVVQRDPTGPEIGSTRTVRGGSWNDPERLLCSAFRFGMPPDARAAGIGLRIAAVP